MTVYVLSITWQMDSGDMGNEINVYETIEKATEEFKKQMEQAKIDFKDLDTESDNYCEGDMGWSIWEAGEYAYNHIDIVIREREVL